MVGCFCLPTALNRGEFISCRWYVVEYHPPMKTKYTKCTCSVKYKSVICRKKRYTVWHPQVMTEIEIRYNVRTTNCHSLALFQRNSVQTTGYINTSTIMHIVDACSLPFVVQVATLDTVATTSCDHRILFIHAAV